MKSFIAILMAALMVLSFVSVASAADTIEVRGQVVNDNFTWNATTFAGFWIDLDTGEFSESLTLNQDAGEIPENTGIVYTAVPKADQTPEFPFDVSETDDTNYTYEKIGFLAEEYFVVDDDVGTLSKILMDDDTRQTLRTGETLILADGYELTPKQIDIDGNKVWLELTKDGNFVDDKIINTVTDSTDEGVKTWYYQMDLNEIEDVDVIMIHVDQVFQGQVDSLCVIDALFQISDDPLVVEVDDEFGELTVTDVNGEIVMTNDDNELDMPDDDTLAITDGIGIKASEDTVRWYLYTEYTEPGTYEIRSSLTEVNTTWDANSFAGFWYDLDAGEFSESLELNQDAGTIPENTGIVYTAVPKADQTPEFPFDVSETDDTNYTYEKIGFLAEEYFVVDDDVGTLSKILTDDDTRQTLRTGESLNLADGYVLTPKQIDVDGNKVWLELTKDGNFVDDKIINTDVDGAVEGLKTWYYQMDLNEIEDVDVIMIHIDQVFQGQVDSLCVIDALFQISDDPLVVEVDDEFGELTVTDVNGEIVMINDDNELDMPDDDTLAITDSIGIKASEDTDRWYIYTTATIEGAVDEAPEGPVVTPEEPVVTPEEPVEDGNVTPIEDGNVTPVEDGNETPVEEPGDADEEDTPGFEAVFAIAGLLAVAFFVRRN